MEARVKLIELCSTHTCRLLDLTAPMPEIILISFSDSFFYSLMQIIMQIMIFISSVRLDPHIQVRKEFVHSLLYAATNSDFHIFLQKINKIYTLA